jgi:hypothetical protein
MTYHTAIIIFPELTTPFLLTSFSLPPGDKQVLLNGIIKLTFVMLRQITLSTLDRLLLQRIGIT